MFNEDHEQIKLSPKIDIENCIKNGYITAEDYKNHINNNMTLYSNEIKNLMIILYSPLNIKCICL